MYPSARIGRAGFDYPAALTTDNPDRFVLTLTGLGLAAALIMHITLTEAVRTQLEPGQLYSSDIVKPPIYYAAHAAQTLLMLWAGLSAALETDSRTIERAYFPRLILLVTLATIMGLRGYAPSDWVSTKLIDITGPFPFYISVLLFVGVRRSNWKFLGKAMVALATLLSGRVIYSVLNLSSFDRDAGVANLANDLNTLFWPAAWVALKDHPRDSFLRRVRLAPIALYAAASLFTQTRLNFVMVAGFLAVFVYLQHRRRAPQAAIWLTGIGLALWGTFFVATFMTDTDAFRKVTYVVESFTERLDEDTRSGQLVWFFRSNSIPELFVGKGSFAKWQWGPEMWNGTDVGYLTLLFYGGIPLLLTYVLTIIKPAFSTIFRNVEDWQLTAAGVVALFALRMFSSTYANVGLDYYPVLLCVGACISREQARSWQ